MKTRPTTSRPCARCRRRRRRAEGGAGRVDFSTGFGLLGSRSRLYGLASLDIDARYDAFSGAAPRLLPPDLPEPFRRLLELANADDSRMSIGGALDLLTQSGVAVEFDPLFRRAAGLGLGIDLLAAMVLARYLGGPLGEFLSADAQAVLAPLQERANEAGAALREIGRRGHALLGLIQQQVACDVLRPRPEDREVLERLARARELLDHFEVELLRSAERLQQVLDRHARRERRAVV